MSEILRVLTSEEAKGVGLFVAGGAIALAGMGYRRTLNRFDERVKALEIDEMTELNTRKVWTRKSVDEMLDSPNSMFGVVFIDFDNFKRINDEVSHQAGDFHLRNGAGVLRFSTKEGDIRGRIGGDEYAVLMNFGKDGTEEGLEAAVDRLKQTFGHYIINAHEFYDLFHPGDKPTPSFEDLGAGISVGGALICTPEGLSRDEAEELLMLALEASDAKMYEDKALNRQR